MLIPLKRGILPQPYLQCQTMKKLMIIRRIFLGWLPNMRHQGLPYGNLTYPRRMMGRGHASFQ